MIKAPIRVSKGMALAVEDVLSNMDHEFVKVSGFVSLFYCFPLE